MANILPSSLIFVTLMMEELCSSEMLVLTRATRRNISEDGIIHSHRRENPKSYTFFVVPQCSTQAQSISDLKLLWQTNYNFFRQSVPKLA
jgi:hypothetical protein